MGYYILFCARLVYNKCFMYLCRAITEDNLRAQIAGETYHLLPLSYIAEHYFGKSAAWLSQRLNGTLVRGRSYTLNEEQKKIFNDAMLDISLRIGSIHLV